MGPVSCTRVFVFAGILICVSIIIIKEIINLRENENGQSMSWSEKAKAWE